MKRILIGLAAAAVLSGSAAAMTTEYGVQLPNCPSSGDRVVLTANVVISGHSEGRIKFIVAPNESIVEILNGCAVSLTAIGWQSYQFADSPPVHVKMQHPTGGGGYSTYVEEDDIVIEILN